MIPAILSCVFVAYLYVSLNAPSSEDIPDSEGGANSPTERLRALESRLQRLLEMSRK